MNSQLRKRDNRPTVAVIGAGVNGLTCAAYLAKSGFAVDVFEISPKAGGLCISETPFKDSAQEVSIVASSSAWLQESVADELQLAKYGLLLGSWANRKIVLLEGDQYIKSGKDFIPELHIDNLSEADREGWQVFWSEIEKGQALLKQHYLKPETTAAKISRALYEAGLERLSRSLFTETLSSYAGQYFKNENLLCAISTYPNCFATEPGSVYAFLHQAIAERNHSSNEIKGAMGQLSTALVKAAESAGAHLHLGKGVKALHTENDLVSTVEFLDGEKQNFDLIIAATCQKTLFDKLLGESTPSGITVHLEVNKAKVISARVHFLLSAPPHFLRLKSLPGYKTVVLAMSQKELSKTQTSIRQGRLPESLLLSIEEDRAVLSVHIHYLPSNINGKEWSERDDRVLLEKVTAVLESEAPGFSRLIKETLVISPRTLKQQFHLEALSGWHQPLSADLLFEKRALPTLPHYHTPFENLFICSAATYPGGEITLANGHNLAKLLSKSKEPEEILITNQTVEF